VPRETGVKVYDGVYDVPTIVNSVEVAIETYRLKAALSDDAPDDVAAEVARSTVEGLRYAVEQGGLIVVSDVTVEIVDAPMDVRSSSERHVVASVRALVDPPAAVREHLAHRELRLEPSVSRVSFPVTAIDVLGTVVDGRREPVATATDHGSHERLVASCEQCQAIVFADTAKRAAGLRDKGGPVDSPKG